MVSFIFDGIKRSFLKRNVMPEGLTQGDLNMGKSVRIMNRILSVVRGTAVLRVYGESIRSEGVEQAKGGQSGAPDRADANTRSARKMHLGSEQPMERMVSSIYGAN